MACTLIAMDVLTLIAMAGSQPKSDGLHPDSDGCPHLNCDGWPPNLRAMASTLIAMAGLQPKGDGWPPTEGRWLASNLRAMAGLQPYERWMACTLIAMDGLQPKCENTVATRPFRSRSLSQSYSHL